MLNKNVIRGIGFVLVMIGLLSVAMGITSTPSPNPLETVNSTVGESKIFSLTSISNNANVTWYINSTPVQTNPNVTVASHTNSTTPAGFWNMSAVVVNVSNPSDVNMTTWLWNVQSPTLGPVTGLTYTAGTTWINWTWTNPGAPFNYTIVRINGTILTNTSDEFYNYTTFSPGTLNTISLQTVDTSGNIHQTPVTDSQYTYNTQTGNDVSVSLPGNLKVIFSQVSSEGNTTVSISPTNSWGGPHSSFIKVGSYYYNINTTAVTSPGTNITIELGYTPGGVNESNINLYHWNGGSWKIVTTNLDKSTKKVKGNVTSLSPFVVGAPPKPIFTFKDPPTPQETIGSGSKTFKVTIDQTTNVTWSINPGSSTSIGQVSAGTEINKSYSLSSPGEYTITVNASNTTSGESNSTSWIWNVRPRTYSSGNRVWDGSKSMNTTYFWDTYSFYAFYYDVNDDVGNEKLQITLNSKTDRTVRKDNLIYTTKPENVSFQYKAWGSYDVIGFMADKYFAAYTGATSTKITGRTPRSTINYMQLHKILIDDKVTRTVRASGTYPLGDGYAVTLKELGSGRQAWISILKDNGEVYSEVKGVGDTIVYSKRVGSVNDLPLIALHIGSVFEGTTESMVQIDGIFQISESYTSASSSNRYGIMEISSTSDTGITMTNRNSFTLSSGSTIDIMGDMKFIVAKNESVLRFAPMIKRSGEYEVRGTISNNENSSEWTPLNFEGFYYNLDDDVGTEKLTLNRTGTTVAKNGLEYITSAQQVSFKSSTLGKYNVIGFMAEKYFAGYPAGKIKSTSISTIERNQLHKVLIDDDTQRVIYAGSTLTLNDGYVLKIKDVNMGAGAGEVWLTLLKDGNEVPGGDDFVEKGELYIYEKDVGAVKGLPLIALRVESIFRGKEATAAFIKGTFQISESYTSVNNGDKFGIMEASVSGTGITMTNPNPVTLSSGSTVDFMKNIKFKVAESSVVRFYPYIMVNGSALAANQLAISVPSSMMVKDTITISVTSGTGTPQDNAEVSFDGEVIGTTNSTGKLDYMLTKAGQHNITATKLGYEKAVLAVQIAEYVDNRLSLVLPEFIDQYIPVSIKVIVSGTGNAISGANITLDGTGIGTTDSSGVLTYTFTDSGKHNLAASRNGYISVQREIEVRMPFTEFKASDINFRPDVVLRGQNVYVWSNITNSGTREGTLPVALIINETVVENKNVTLAPGKYGEVNFSYRIDLPSGNYTVEILGQQTTMPVKDEPLNIFLVVGAITGLGALTVYFLTSKNLMSVEAIKSKMNMETVNQVVAKARSDLESLSSKFLKGGGKGGSPPPKFDPFKRFDK